MESRWRKIGRAMRLTVGVLCCLVAVGLCVLWALSYRGYYTVMHDGWIGCGSTGVNLGQVYFDQYTYSQQLGDRPSFHFAITELPQAAIDQLAREPRFRFFLLPSAFMAAVPCWFLVSLASLAAYLCIRPPRRFTVRGMLIATTVAAVVCGLIVSEV